MARVKSNKLLKALTQVSAWTGLSRVFGLIRDIATTSLLGASVFHDIFVVTLKIPNLFRRFFAEGALTKHLFQFIVTIRKAKMKKIYTTFSML